MTKDFVSPVHEGKLDELYFGSWEEQRTKVMVCNNYKLILKNCLFTNKVTQDKKKLMRETELLL